MNKILTQLLVLNKLGFEISLIQTFNILEIYFSEKANNFKKEFSAKYKNIKNFKSVDKPDFRKLIELYSDESILSMALFLKMYSTVEIYLDEYCRIYENHSNFELKINDLKGKGIIRSKTFLEKVAKRRIIKKSSDWEFLICLNKIRNTLIHSNDFEDTLPKTISKFFDSSEIKFDKITGITLRSEFLKKVNKRLLVIFDLSKKNNGA